MQKKVSSARLLPMPKCQQELRQNSYNKTNSFNMNGSPNRPYKQLTSREEIDEKRGKGLCFQCDERYTPGH